MHCLSIMRVVSEKFCDIYRMQLIMAVESALKLVVKGREVYYYYLNDCLCRMVELFLLLRGKLVAVDDKEIQSSMLYDWDLSMFVKKLIQALISSKKFGAYDKYNEEIKVLCVCVCVCVCVCACACACERESVSMSVCVCVCVCMRVYVCVC